MASHNHLSYAIWTVLACGCATESGDPSLPPTGDPSLPPTGDPSCSGGDRFVLGGARMLESTSLATVTSDDKVTGVNGATSGNEVFLFTTRRFWDSVDQLGEYDVASTPMQFLQFALSESSCETTASGCTGFFALAGHYSVLEISPRYRATFELTDLHERSDTSSQPGSAIAGTVTGCVDIAQGR